MDHRSQAEELYKLTRCNNSENSNQLTTVKEYLRHFVCKCQPSQKFKVIEIPSIIMKSAKQESFISSKASESFEKLEYYFSLVSSNPWKAEFHTIKKYSGFFQTKIASHLTGVEELFRIAGYSENPIKNEFKLSKNINKELLLALAFECFIASVECIIIHELQIRTKFSINAANIANLRTTYSGDVEEMYSVLRKSFNLKKDDCIMTSPDQTIKNIDHVDQLSPRQQQMKTQHGQALSVVESDVRPEILNSEFKEGTLEDHMMASLQLIEEEKEEMSQTPKQPSVRPSDEWSFVNEGLLKKYGEKYFNGQRGNILQTPSSKESRPYRDSGIESGVHSELPYADVDTIRTRSTRVIKEKNPHSAVHAQISWPTHPEQSPLHRPQYSWPQHEPVAPQVHRPQFSSPFPQGQQQTTKAELLRARNKSVSSAFPPDQWPPKENVKSEIVEQSTTDDFVGVIRPSRSITKTDFVFETPQNPTAAPVYSRISKPVVNDKLSSPGHCQPFAFSSHSAPVARREPEERIPSCSLGDEETWICDHCTMKNNRYVNTCYMCSKSRDIVKSPDVRWGKQCPRCTLLNKADSYACEACDNKLPEACDNPV
ncbi:SPATA2 [Mytilus coruscus]|uniref:SPATA2 n=1 Tax=Mytilus coruscus TaxID=42192 RepID=A0A6J8BYV2_MYTCO|nr:SPATA2 [Mytilus coruscus]